MLRWLIGIILGEITLRILKLATYTKNKDHYFKSFKLATLDRKGLAQMFHILFCQFDDTIEVDFHLGHKYLGSSF